ncbi:MAG TPA: alpha/beta fold hydrolase [Solirubrobacteraceae bacterium]|jgi:2-succinyl-6-hydroxy-2,4-cyclohexadiene-1-carboxylate synthase|nr:alpha/beta fold hydrolase [Solirubrobacteraceae bacterium]
MPENVVLLHGFAGTRRAWDGMIAALDHERYRPLALDLPGHGDAAHAERPITFAGCVERVLARGPERFVLCGYSMGGRVALHVALAAPERVTRLVLVSTSAGIADTAARERRQQADRALADELERMPFEDFIERWRTQPLFADEPAAVGAHARADHRRNRPAALAAALRGIGTGAMQSLWSRLGELEMPVTVVVGERDHRYRELGARMVELIPHAELVILAGGHGLALENPLGLSDALATARPSARSPTAP